LFFRGVRRWLQHDGPGLSAAVSFYAVFAMAPLLVFAVLLASKALGPEQARASAVNWLADMVPFEMAESLVSIIQVKLLAGGAWWANLISGLVMIWAASLIFVRLVIGTRAMAGESIEETRSEFHRSLISRGIAILFAIAVGLLICVVFVASSLLTPLMDHLPVGTKTLVSVANAFLLMVGGVILMQIVSSHRLPKRALLVTGGFLFLAFILGRLLFQAYINHSAITSAYGVASSLVVFLIWIYYMACGYFIGAAVCSEIESEARTKRDGDGEEGGRRRIISA